MGTSRVPVRNTQADKQPAATRPTVVPLGDSLGSAPTLKPFMFLEAIAQAERALSVSELSALLNVPQPTAHRIIHLLEGEGLLEREPGTRRFMPGRRLVRMGVGVVATSVRAAPRRAILEALSKQIDETCNFGIQVGNQLIYLDRVEAAWPFGLRFEPGSRVPLHCTAMGKMFLSFMPLVQLQRLLACAPLHRYTEQTITDPVLFAAELAKIREAEVSTDNQEFLAGVVCVAVPVRSRNGGLAASLAMSAPTARMSLEHALQFVPLLRDAARRMSDTLRTPDEGQAPDHQQSTRQTLR